MKPLHLLRNALLIAAIVWLSNNLSTTATAADEPIGNTPSKVKVVPVKGGFKFVESGKDILVYNRDAIAAPDGTHARGHYIHPMYDLDGVRMTDDMPRDHVHHRGVFWAWTQLYLNDERFGHPWEQRGQTWDVKEVKVIGDAHSTAIQCDVIWTTDVPGKKIPLVHEIAVIRVNEAEPNARVLDFRITLQALEKGVKIGGSTDTKGYGGFSVRTPLPSDMKILGPNGAVEPNLTLPSPPQPWVDFSGSFDGPDKTTGLAILVHPSHPGYPLGWTIRKSASCQNPVFPGRELVTISTTEPMVLRYQIVMHRGGLADAGIPKYFQAFSDQK